MWQKTISIRLICFSLLALFNFNHNAYGFNMSYVEVNSNRLENVGCFIRSDNHQPFFGVTAIFAANITGDDPNDPKIFFNGNVKKVLQSAQIKHLQNKGIKVLMSLLNHHKNAGWSCMTDENAAKRFADELVTMVNTYQLDGIDIDDEYSTCQPNNYSLIMLAQAIKTHPNFKGKLLTKALFNDVQYFMVNYKDHRLAEYLDYGWEMTYSYGNFNERLAPYLQNGMTADRLMIGGWAAYTYPDPYQIGLYTAQKSLAGAMVYDVTRLSQKYLSQVLNGEAGKQIGIDVEANCLQSS